MSETGPANGRGDRVWEEAEVRGVRMAATAATAVNSNLSWAANVDCGSATASQGGTTLESRRAIEALICRIPVRAGMSAA